METLNRAVKQGRGNNTFHRGIEKKMLLWVPEGGILKETRTIGIKEHIQW